MSGCRCSLTKATDCSRLYSGTRQEAREINTEQFEMILDSSKTKVVMEQEHPALLRGYYKPLKRRSQGCKRKHALTRRILSLIEKPIRIF